MASRLEQGREVVRKKKKPVFDRYISELVITTSAIISFITYSYTYLEFDVG
jgi:preprotein translocase subunit Sss1